MTRREYTNEIIHQWGGELAAVLEQVTKFGLERVSKHGYFDVKGIAIPAEQVNPQHWGPRLKALVASEVARDLASAGAAHDGGPDPKLIAEIFSDGVARKTDRLAQLLMGAREIHAKTGKGVGYPFFPFFDGADRRNGEALVRALTPEERKLLGVGEFETARPPVAPASGSLDVLLKHIEDRNAYVGRTPVQAFFNYFSPEEEDKDNKKPPVAVTDTSKSTTKSLDVTADLGNREVKETKVSKTTLEEIAAPPAPAIPVIPVVADLGAPVPKVETTTATPAAVITSEKVVSIEGNGKATNGGAEASQLADLLEGLNKDVASAVAKGLRNGSTSVDKARQIAAKYNWI